MVRLKRQGSSQRVCRPQKGLDVIPSTNNAQQLVFETRGRPLYAIQISV